MNRSLLLALRLCQRHGRPRQSTTPTFRTPVQYRGNFNVNQAAGDQMQQTNTKAIAIGTNASATTIVRQKLIPCQPVDERQRHHWRHLFQQWQRDPGEPGPVPTTRWPT
jgi:hypothetical protein